MTTHEPRHPDPDDDARLEEQITSGILDDYAHDGTSRRRSAAGVVTGIGAPDGKPATAETHGIRTGVLVWGVIALLVALWSLSATVLDWDIDPSLMLIVLAGAGGIALVAGGVFGASRTSD